MSIPTGIAGQLGWRKESTYGTGITVTQFVPFVSLGFNEEIDQLESRAIRANRLQLSTLDYTTGRKWISGGFETEMYSQSLGSLFFCAMGANSTTGGGPYTHTLTPGDLTADSLTIQGGYPDTAGTVQPFTYSGVKVNTLTVEANAGELGKITVDVIGQALTTATALATASYAASNSPMTFIQGAVTLASSAVTNCEKFSLSIANGFNPRHFIGAAATSEPLQATQQVISGTLDMEFDGLTDYNRYRNATQAALVLAFSDGTNSMTATMNVYFSGGTPQVDGAGIVKISQPFKALGTTDAAACTIVLVNSDSLLTA
jgi:hypothetical protein